MWSQQAQGQKKGSGREFMVIGYKTHWTVVLRGYKKQEMKSQKRSNECSNEMGPSAAASPEWKAFEGGQCLR